MSLKFQDTRLHRNIGRALERLDLWAVNPWRRISLLIIVLLSAFLIGSSIGMLNGVLALMDPVGAFIVLVIWEMMVRIRRKWVNSKYSPLSLQLLDMARIGLLYGLLLEGFKLL